MKRTASLFGVLALVLLLAPVASAQETRGSIQGAVKDTSGAVLPGVTVEARTANGSGTLTTVTDAGGVYRFPSLAPGVYEVTASLTGFGPRKVEDIQRRVVDVKIDQFLDAPADRGAQLVGRHVRRFGQEQRVFVRVENGGTA